MIFLRKGYFLKTNPKELCLLNRMQPRSKPIVVVLLFRNKDQGWIHLKIKFKSQESLQLKVRCQESMMANVIGSSSSTSALKVAPNTIHLNVILLVIAVFAIILNLTEIHLIRKKWKKATDFEVLLLHLGIADFLTGIGFLVIASLGIAAYAKKEPKSNYYSFISMGVVTFFCIVSTKFVIVIGIERLLAIKLPLKHRLWHTTRKTMYKRIGAVWVVSLIVISSAYLSDYFIQKSKGRSGPMSRFLAYALAAYLSLGACIVIVTYSWLLQAVVKRSEKSFNFDKKDYKKSPNICRKAFCKEKATVIVCWLVSGTFLVCNIPTIVALYSGEMSGAAVSLSSLNSVMNPLIYFFKGYVEKRYSKRRLTVSSSDTGSSSEMRESPSLKAKNSDLSSKSENPSTESNGKLKPNGQMSGGLRDRGQTSQMKSNSPSQMAVINEEKHDDLSKSNGHESGSLKDRGEGSRKKIVFPDEKGNFNGDISTVYANTSESSRVNDDDILNTLDPKEDNQQLESAKYKGEEQGERIPDKLNLSVEMDTASLAGKNYLCVNDYHESGSSNDKGEDQGEILPNKPDSFVGVETVDSIRKDDLYTMNGHDIEGSDVKGQSSVYTSDNAVKLSSVVDTLNGETFKNRMLKIMDGHEETHL